MNDSHMDRHLPLLADIAKKAPLRRAPIVKCQAIAARYCNVHAVAAEGCMRERPVGS